MKIHSYFRKIVSFGTAASLALAPLQLRAGNLDAEVNDMFNSLGAVGNYSAPGAFKGQTYNTFTGGSLYMRSPNRTYQLLAMNYPTAKAGCGGIDLFGGSMSAISADEFKAMLQNITSALPGIAFQVALDAVSPLLGGITKWAKSLESWINNARINSCETASSLVSNAMEAGGVSATDMCAKIAVSTGLEPDINKAKQRCRSDRAGILKNARESGDPSQDIAPFVGNMTWAALQKVPNLDDPAREIAMSIIGTYIYYPEEESKQRAAFGPAIKDIGSLLDGQQDAGAGKIRIQMLKCNNYTACDQVQYQDVDHTPLTARVESLMKQLANHIRDRAAYGPTDGPLISFVNQTSIPVWRMLAVGGTMPNSDLNDVLIQNYKHVVASDYALVLLKRFASVGLNALLQNPRLTAEQRIDAAQLRTDLQQFMNLLHQDQAVKYQKLASVSQVASDIERLDRTLRMSMSSHITDMLRQSYLGPR